MSDTNTMNPTSKFSVPTLGAGNPGIPGVTTPGSFANKPDIGGPLAFSSPRHPGHAQAFRQNCVGFPAR